MSSNICSLECVSSDVLAMFFERFNTKASDKQTFVNFWIACYSNGNQRLKLKSAMLNIDVYGCFEKVKFSNLTPYLTDIQIDLFSEGIAGGIGYCNKILEIQKLCPRIKSIQICWVRLGEISDTMISSLLNTLKKFSKLEKIHFGNWITVTPQHLKFFPNLQSVNVVSLEINPEMENVQLPNVQTFRSENLMDFSIFKNLSALHIKREHFINACTETKYLDLTMLTHLENFTFDSNDYHIVDITINSLFLRRIKLGDGVQLINNCSLTNLTSMALIIYNHNHFPSFRSDNLCLTASNLKILQIKFIHPDIDSQRCQPIISSIAAFSQIRCLKIVGLASTSAILWPLKSLTNLSSLFLKKITIMPSDKIILDHIIQSRITRLEWDRVKYFDRPLRYPVPSANAISKLTYLKARMLSADWIDLLPKLIEIRHLHLINCEICVNWDLFDDVYPYDLDIDTSYKVTPVNPDEFVVKFNALRLNKINEILEKIDSNGRITSIFHLEELPYKNCSIYDDAICDKDSLQRTTIDWMLKTRHNEILKEFNSKIDSGLLLQFTLESWPKQY
jgi:hypothetical protein